MLLYSWLAVVVLVRLTQNCLLAARELTHGFHNVGLAITEFSMLHFLVVAFLFPFLASVLSLGSAGLNRSRLALTSVRLGSLLLSELAALAARPLSWVMFVFLVPAAIPLLAISHSAMAVISLCVTFVGALLLAAAAGQALGMSRHARAFAGASRFVVAAVMIGLVLANFDFQWGDSSIQLLVRRWRVPLLDSQAGGLLPALRPWSPSAWIVQGWLLPSLLFVAASMLLFAFMVRWEYRTQTGVSTPSIHVAPARRVTSSPRRTRGIRSLLFRKELRSFGARLGSLGGITAALAFSAWICLEKQPFVGIALLGCFVIYLSNFAYPANLFGSDGGAIRRYALAGVAWPDVVLSKDLAWVSVMAVSLVLVIAADVVRVSIVSALSLALACALVIALTLSWGIMSSILFPSAGPRSRPAFANLVAPFLFCAAVLMVHRNVAVFGSAGFDIATALLFAGGLALFAALIRRVGNNFDKDLEDVLERMRAS